MSNIPFNEVMNTEPDDTPAQETPLPRPSGPHKRDGGWGSIKL